MRRRRPLDPAQIDWQAVTDTLLPSEAEAAARESRTARALTELNHVVVATLAPDGVPLPDADAEAVFERLVHSHHTVVTLDFRGIEDITPALTLAVAELSGDLAYRKRLLLCVNAGPAVGGSLRIAGLSDSAVIQTAE